MVKLVSANNSTPKYPRGQQVFLFTSHSYIRTCTTNQSSLMNLKLGAGLVAVGGAQRTKWKSRYTGGVKHVSVDHFMGKGEGGSGL